jgi:hypothetical protein
MFQASFRNTARLAIQKRNDRATASVVAIVQQPINDKTGKPTMQRRTHALLRCDRSATDQRQDRQQQPKHQTHPTAS